jgi:hypothetical protein
MNQSSRNLSGKANEQTTAVNTLAREAEYSLAMLSRNLRMLILRVYQKCMTIKHYIVSQNV